MALRILENGGQAYVDLLLYQAATSPLSTATPENLVKQLVDKYSLDELVSLTKRLTTSPEMQDWVKKAAKSTPDATETSQKAAIAQRLVKEFGVDAIQKEMARQP